MRMCKENRGATGTPSARRWALCTAHNIAAELTGTSLYCLYWHIADGPHGSSRSGGLFGDPSHWRRFALRGRRRGNHERDPHIPAIGPVVYAACVSLDGTQMQIRGQAGQTPPAHLWIGRKSRQFLSSQRSTNARATIPAEILASNPSCASPTAQLKRE